MFLKFGFFAHIPVGFITEFLGDGHVAINYTILNGGNDCRTWSFIAFGSVLFSRIPNPFYFSLAKGCTRVNPGILEPAGLSRSLIPRSLCHDEVRV